DRTSVLSLQSASDLGRRPVLSQPLQDLGLKRRLTKQSASPPATAFSLLFSIDRLIAHFSATVAFEFTRYSRWRAIHSCRDFADCFPGFQAPVWAPKDLGLMAKYGFNGDVVLVPGSVRQIQALQGGSIHFAQADAATAINAINHGADLVMISGSLNSFPYTFMAQKEIRKPGDLVG